MEAWGMFLAVRRSDASERTVVLPDPMEPVIRSAVIGGIGIWFLAQGILDQSSLRDLSRLFVADPGLRPGLISLASHSGLMSHSLLRFGLGRAKARPYNFSRGLKSCRDGAQQCCAPTGAAAVITGRRGRRRQIWNNTFSRRWG